MRLIDADALLEKLKCTPRYFEVKHDIEEMPTVFDMEKVMEQLNDEIDIACANFYDYVNEIEPELDARCDDFFYRGLERAKIIFRRGSVE